MFSFKPLALCAFFAFGIISSWAAPSTPESAAGAALGAIVQTFGDSLSASLQQMDESRVTVVYYVVEDSWIPPDSLTADDMSFQTLKPIADDINSSFAITADSMQSYGGCGESCSTIPLPMELIESLNLAVIKAYQIMGLVDYLLPENAVDLFSDINSDLTEKKLYLVF